MTDSNPGEAYEVVRREPGPLPHAVAFLITASELRDRKTKWRRKHDLPGGSEAIRRLVEPGLNVKGK